MKKAINKDIVKELLKTKSKFISIVVMMFLGVFIFIGLKETSPTMRNTINTYFSNYKMYDMKISNNFRLNADDIKALKTLTNIEILDEYSSESFQLDTESIDVVSKPKQLATLQITEGRNVENSSEIVLSEALSKKYALGDSITFKDSQGKLKNGTYKIVGFCHWVDRIENSTYNSASKDYFAFITDDNYINKDVSGVYLKFKDSPENVTTKGYEEFIKSKKIEVENLLNNRVAINNINYKKETAEKISKAQEDIKTAKEQIKVAKESLEQLKFVDNKQYLEKIEQLKLEENKLLSSEKKLTVEKRAFDDNEFPDYQITTLKTAKIINQFISGADGLTFVANVFSLFLFMVAVLVCLTTLTRMIDENRINIGTLKALGYSNFQISKKYYIYGVVSTLVGTILGVLAGYKIIVPLVYNSYARFLVIQKPLITYDKFILLSSVVIAVGCITFAIYIPLRKNLKENTASLLRPKSLPAGKKILLERITFLWKRLSFLRKITFRNIFRYKVRMLMTIFGVLGCVSLMFIGFAIRYGLGVSGEEQFKNITKYNIAVTYNPYIYEDDKKEIESTVKNNSDVEKSINVNLQSGEVRDSDKDIIDNVFLVTLNDEYASYINIKNSKGNIVLNDNGLVISSKFAYLYDLKIGDSFTIKVKNKKYDFKVENIADNYFGHNFYMTKNYYEKVFGKDYKENTILVKNKNLTNNELLKETLYKNGNVVNIIDNSKFQDALNDAIKGMNTLVGVMVFCSLSLALVVVYNLINVNVSERVRELSTIKVLGFYAKEVTSYVFREIIYLTIVGIIIGSYLGYKMYIKISLELADRQMLFETRVPIYIYLISAVITLAITIFIMLLIHRRLKKIDMIEALKGVE